MLYTWLKAFHIISVIAWMAGMFYLPRLFAYHADAKPGSELSETLKVMERKLQRFIILPAMLLTFTFGGLLLWQNPGLLHEPFMHVKLGLVLVMAGLHGFFARCRRAFAEDRNRYSTKFYRILNEVPVVLMIGIVIMIVVQPEL